MSAWITVPEAAAAAGLSRTQMWRRLRALDAVAGGRLLRHGSTTGRVGKWEVCVEVLRELRDYDPGARDQEIRNVHGRLDEVDEKLDALRNAHHGFRRRAEKALVDQEKKILALFELNKAQSEAIRVFTGG